MKILRTFAYPFALVLTVIDIARGKAMPPPPEDRLDHQQVRDDGSDMPAIFGQDICVAETREEEQ